MYTFFYSAILEKTIACFVFCFVLHPLAFIEVQETPPSFNKPDAKQYYQNHVSAASPLLP
jgi:hypothetical protein